MISLVKINCRAMLFLSLVSLLSLMGFLAAYSGAEEKPGVTFQFGKGRIIGQVRTTKFRERPDALPVFKNRDFCGIRIPNESLLVDQDGRLQNAVVILRSSGDVPVARPDRVVLDNKNCAFVPHVQVVPVGSELVLKNSDGILHAVHARLGKETLFNVGLPNWRQVRTLLDRVGVININCDVLHTWMSAVIVVTSSPYAAVTDDNGFFVIENVPAGNYELEVWHETLGLLKRKVRVGRNGLFSIEVVYGSGEPGP